MLISSSDAYRFTFYIEAGQITTKPDVNFLFEQADVSVFTEVLCSWWTSFGKSTILLSLNPSVSAKNL